MTTGGWHSSLTKTTNAQHIRKHPDVETRVEAEATEAAADAMVAGRLDECESRNPKTINPKTMWISNVTRSSYLITPIS